MCGRARCTLRADDVPRACYRDRAPARFVNMDRYRPSYNVSPGFNLPVLHRASDGEDVVHCMRWGLIPSFTKKSEKPDFYKMFNARSESISEKASFRRLLPKSRCLVAVEGFYEWKKDGSKKQPYYIHFKDGRPLVFAALYDSWETSAGEKFDTFTILTMSSSAALQWLHDRMPVILGDKASADTWLNGSKFDTVLKPYENPDLVWYPVTPAMSKPSYDGPECIKEIQLKTEEKNLISKFFSTKEMKKEGSNKEEKNMCDESVKTHLCKSLKEEPSTEDFAATRKEDNESKSCVSMPDEGAVKCQTKREYDEFSADAKPVTDEIDERGRSPSKKKRNLKIGNDNQPTLLSYFGKK